MIRGFSTKKIKSQKTLGEYLKYERVKQNFSLSDAELGTKVKAKYLTSIENDDWTAVPESVYLRGFVLAYAKYLKLDIPAILEKFEKEAKIHDQSTPSEISYQKRISNKKLLITPKILAYTALASFVIFMFSYIVIQVKNFAGNPNLKIVTPANNTVIETDSLDLVGVTDTDSQVNVNNENIPVSGDGKFFLTLKLHRGVNVIKVEAVNKAKKESSQVYTVEYKPKTAAIDNNFNQ